MNRPTLRKTKEYNKFHYHPAQRDIREGHKKRIERDVVENGYIASQPVTVCEHPTKPGHYIIIDGHHRFKGCRDAGVPFYFVCIGGPEHAESPETLRRINSNQKTWSGGDDLQQHISLGHDDYITIQSWMDRYGFTLAQLQHGIGVRGYSKDSFREGRVKLRSERRVAGIALLRDQVVAATNCKITQKLVFTIKDVFDTPELDKTRLIAGLKSSKRFRTSMDKDAILQDFEKAYNYRRRDKVPFAFNVREAARERMKKPKKANKAA